MVQTLHAMTAKDFEIDVSTDASTWVDISGSAASISMEGGERETGSAHTAGDADPLTGIGPKAPGEGTLTVIYTEVATTEAADLVDGYYEAGTRVYLRARPRGTTVGHWQWISRGWFTTPVAPVLDAASGDILVREIGWFGSPWTQSAQVS